MVWYTMQRIEFPYKPRICYVELFFALLSIIFDVVSGIFILYVCFEFSIIGKGTPNSKIVQGSSRRGANDWLWLWLWLVTAAMNMNISPSIKEDKQDDNNTNNGKSNGNDKSNDNGSKGFSWQVVVYVVIVQRIVFSSDNEGSEKLLIYSFRDPDSLPLPPKMNSVESSLATLLDVEKQLRDQYYFKMQEKVQKKQSNLEGGLVYRKLLQKTFETRF